MYRNIIKNFLLRLMDRPLPPANECEYKYISELRASFDEFQVFDDDGYEPSEKEWRGNISRLRKLVLNNDPREFLRWDVITKTMFITYADYIKTELRYLKKHSNWVSRWRDAIKETAVGHPNPYIFYPVSSGNLIHHAYHLAQLEEKTNSQVHNLNYVFEFGGGYGSMCRLFHNLGFQGKYIIFDLPEFSAMQRYYLKTLGLPEVSEAEFKEAKSGFICVSELHRLADLLKVVNQDQGCASLFLATWSLSETPVAIRGPIMSMINSFSQFLIAYQNTFGEVDNIDYFDNFKIKKNDIDWYNSEIKHLPASYYLLGKTRS